jgi:hypothetical protein
MVLRIITGILSRTAADATTQLSLTTMQTQEIQWVVQSNLTSQYDLAALRTAYTGNRLPYVEVTIIPFTDELPDLPIRPCTIYYGSTTFNNLLYNNPATRPGVFFNPDTFSIENYISKWSKYMLNAEASVITFKELINQPYSEDTLLFIRPNDDSKSFAGEVKKFSEIGAWYESLEKVSAVDLSPDSKIVVSKPYSLKYEWRLWIVDKKVVAASRYREYFKLSKEQGCPAEVVTFAEARCREYTPHDIFVMDVCLTGDDYYIVECGCMNAAGFYKADVAAIVKSVSGYFGKMYCR